MPTAILRKGDDRIAPLVCVHPVSGRIERYQRLATEIAWPGAILGIHAPEPAPERFVLADLAQSYVAELPPGPVLLLGWSLGGIIAAQMSQHLGPDRVRFLGVIDSRVPVPEMKQRPTDRETMSRAYYTYCAVNIESENFKPPTDVHVPERLLAALHAIGATDFAADLADLERRLTMFMALSRGFFHHDLARVAVPVNLFEASDAHPIHPRPATLGWETVADAVQRDRVPGTHFTVLADRFCAGLGSTISRRLPS